MTSLWHYLFGEDAGWKARRAIVHENKNEAQKSIASARTLTKASIEAERTAKAAIDHMENKNHKGSH